MDRVNYEDYKEEIVKEYIKSRLHWGVSAAYYFAERKIPIPIPKQQSFLLSLGNALNAASYRENLEKNEKLYNYLGLPVPGKSDLLHKIERCFQKVNEDPRLQKEVMEKVREYKKIYENWKDKNILFGLFYERYESIQKNIDDTISSLNLILSQQGIEEVETFLIKEILEERLALKKVLEEGSK